MNKILKKLHKRTTNLKIEKFYLKKKKYSKKRAKFDLCHINIFAFFSPMNFTKYLERYEEYIKFKN